MKIFSSCFNVYFNLLIIFLQENNKIKIISFFMRTIIFYIKYIIVIKKRFNYFFTKFTFKHFLLLVI